MTDRHASKTAHTQATPTRTSQRFGSVGQDTARTSTPATTLGGHRPGPAGGPAQSTAFQLGARRHRVGPGCQDAGADPSRDPDTHHPAADSVDRAALFRAVPESQLHSAACKTTAERPRIMGETKATAGVARSEPRHSGKEGGTWRTAQDSDKAPEDGDQARRPGTRGDPDSPQAGRGGRPIRRQARDGLASAPGTCDRSTGSCVAFPIGMLTAQEPFSRMDDRWMMTSSRGSRAALERTGRWTRPKPPEGLDRAGTATPRVTAHGIRNQADERDGSW